MGIIDRYLLRQFLKTFLICFCSFMGLYVVIECSTNMEEFIRCGEKMGGALRLIGEYYSYRTFAFFDVINGMLVLISAMFTVSWIQRHNEMTALMAAGVSRIRIVTPLFVAAVVISLLAAANREFIIPRFREELSRRPQDLRTGQRAPFAPAKRQPTPRGHARHERANQHGELLVDAAVDRLERQQQQEFEADHGEAHRGRG